MRIDEYNTCITTINDRPVLVRIMVPEGYENSDKRYPVLYVSDGQDLYRDDQTYRGAESLRLEQYMDDYGKFMPQVIYVAISAPFDPAERTAEYSPYTKDFDVPPEKKFEPHIDGLGKEYLQWMVTDLKNYVDATYRTLPDPDNTAYAGYSTGGLSAVYAAVSHPETFHRIIAMSSAVCIWLDKLQESLDTGSYSHLKYLYMDVGTNEFGRMTTKEEFLDGANMMYENYLKHGVPAEIIKYNIYPDAMHNQREWRYRFPDAVRWIFQDKD
ncbi:MAG: alpha/beta hydrolase [Solobacterium sp.]|nr:alpha/beta hydrolase [Solobacterium sp.]